MGTLATPNRWLAHQKPLEQSPEALVGSPHFLSRQPNLPTRSPPVSEPKHAAPRPVTFGDLFQNREYRALYSASTLSWVGDYLARAAVTALIFHTTRSVALSAAAFAVGYLPGLTGGPILAALAERYPHRTAMVTCDLLRAWLDRDRGDPRPPGRCHLRAALLHRRAEPAVRRVPIGAAAPHSRGRPLRRRHLAAQHDPRPRPWSWATSPAPPSHRPSRTRCCSSTRSPSSRRRP